ncbi:tumor necrosis factor receptor superfamily member 11B-like [Lingula anatina]|uniref:Tumor necrosis factor receptor superfamily member 11B-like n=1 Tax=Lingula anatina TaxID=7574 RepID=A0A1S3JR61_LINAN|nr:tumor necrosis factor receptor superfamily member 11B-like [Lingula anatina]|eukprot:XP_013412474.1 tumor necrosis factor receptor superfamily member 11B-like [Lingula anatina]
MIMAAFGFLLENLSLFIVVFFEVSNLMVAEVEHYKTASGLGCEACQPGTHLLADCTGTTPTRCEPCVPQLTFSTQYNAAPSCQLCSGGCHGHAEEQVANCTVTKDRVCGCVDGYYRWQHWGHCQRHTPCRLGFGVKQLGSRENNTQCEKCRHGYYSDHVSLTQKCRKHTDCSALGLVEMKEGTRFSDVVCGPCPTDGNITDHTAATSGVTVDPGVEGQTTTFGFDLGTVRNNITNFTIDSVLERPAAQISCYGRCMKRWKVSCITAFRLGLF